MKKNLQRLLAVLILCFTSVQIFSQAVKVTKTNPLKVFMHYMPWFDAPINPVAGNTYNWGYHWKMNTRNPNIIDTNGQREIASHYYPLIGPYASKDPNVIEYHLLLMKLAGIDGVLIDWYGKTGSNADEASLLTNSDSLINRTAGAGIDFGLVAEDRFWSSVQDGKNAMAYAKDNYFSKSNYITIGSPDEPLVCEFGPTRYTDANSWTQILSSAGQPVQFLPLSANNSNLGTNVNGKFDWVYSNNYNGLINFYNNIAPNLGTAIGAAYPRFNDYYKQGGAGNTLFYIADNNGQTLDSTLSLAKKYTSRIDALQLVTFNDFGEGTVFEPTVEYGFRDLAKVQQFTGVPYTETDLAQVYRLYTLRKKFVGNAAKQATLDRVFNYFASLQTTNAYALMDSLENINAHTPKISVSASGTPSENGGTGYFIISATNISSNVTIKYTIGGTASAAHYIADPLFTDSLILTPSSASDTIVITAVDDTIVNPKETIQFNIIEDTSYNIVTPKASLTIIDNETPACSGPMIVYTSYAPVIDGAADGIWDKAPANSISQIISGTIQQGSTWQALYDSTNLYLLVHVKDSNLSTIGTNIWDQDGVEVFIAGNNYKAGAYTANDHQYRFNWNILPYSNENITGATGNKTGINYAIPTTTGGYTLEASIPWSTIGGTAPFNGKQIGFDIDINDQQTNAGQREATVGWNDVNNDDYQNTSGFGTAELTICNGDTVPKAPVIVSIDSTHGNERQAFGGYKILADNSPESFGATGLPSGLTINTSTGVISGTPTVWGVFTVAISAKNNVGTDNKSLRIVIDSTPAVEYISVSATRQLNGTSLVQWVVDSEISIQQYEIESSVDSVEFTTIGTVTNIANAYTHTTTYNATDANPARGKIYYRIKGISLNGDIYYSEVISADKINGSLNIYPNPVRNHMFYIPFKNSNSKKYTALLLNAVGELASKTSINVDAGNTTYTFQMSNKALSGFYTLELIDEKGLCSYYKIIVE